jgi:Fe-Mn family superoxide dismutase
MPYQLPDLGYAYDALEPHIDAKTMKIHHSKHHSGYTAKLNAAVEGTGLDGTPIVTLLTQMDMGNAALRNNAGGYYNHDLFWKVISPNNRGSLSGALKAAIEASFDSLESFKETFSNAAVGQFG